MRCSTSRPASSSSATAPASRRTLEELIAKYPQSEAAAKARQRLASAERRARRGAAPRRSACRHRAATLRPRARLRSVHRSAPVPFCRASRRVAATHGRHDLPWQRTRDPYRDLAVRDHAAADAGRDGRSRIYERFVASFPDVRALAAAPLDRVLEHWSGLGYYRRAHHLHAAAKAIVDEHGGEFPRDAATIATLPGIGRSTAAAIAAFAFGARAAILDGNVKRVLARHRGVEGFPGSPQVERDAVANRRVAAARTRHRDLYAGADGPRRDGVHASAPRCGECPVAADCVARRERSRRAVAVAAPREARAPAARGARAGRRARRRDPVREAPADRHLGRPVEPARGRRRRRRRRALPRALCRRA